jgi:hypothetical protein
MYLCTTRVWSITIDDFNFEHEKSNNCSLLTQEGEKQCAECK